MNPKNKLQTDKRLIEKLERLVKFKNGEDLHVLPQINGQSCMTSYSPLSGRALYGQTFEKVHTFVKMKRLSMRELSKVINLFNSELNTISNINLSLLYLFSSCLASENQSYFYFSQDLR